MEHINLFEIIKFAIELIVLVIILREIIELKRHRTSLEKHSLTLDKVRPLFTTLYTDGDDILKLATDFTKQANVCYAFGSLESLIDTERRKNETQFNFEERMKTISKYKIDYVNETENFILSGKNYYRIMDFSPRNQAHDDMVIQLNISYFIRLSEFSGTRQINLNIYHNTEIPIISGDFHFRCSDSQVIIRAGGHGNKYTNNAIVITDTRVVQEYQRYYQSVIDSIKTRKLNYDDLVQLRKLYSEGDYQSVKKFLQVTNEKSI